MKCLSVSVGNHQLVLTCSSLCISADFIILPIVLTVSLLINVLFLMICTSTSLYISFFQVFIVIYAWLCLLKYSPCLAALLFVTDCVARTHTNMKMKVIM